MEDKKNDVAEQTAVSEEELSKVAGGYGTTKTYTINWRGWTVKGAAYKKATTQEQIDRMYRSSCPAGCGYFEHYQKDRIGMWGYCSRCNTVWEWDEK